MNTKWKSKIDRTLREVNEAFRVTSQLKSPQKKKMLSEVAAELEKSTAVIIKENKKDLIRAKKMGLSSAMIDRLTLSHERIRSMAKGVRQVASLPEYIGQIQSKWKRPNGLQISKVTVPIGVILIIFESRPNVTVECASLCLKSGNSVILRGGKEAFDSNKVLVGIFKKVLKKHKVPQGAVSFVDTTDRAVVDYLLKRDEQIHLVIPRGGEALIRKVARSSHIPVVKHFQGICHVYVDDKANLRKAVDIAYNAKMHRPGVCNAMEALLVHKKIASKFLPSLGEKLKAGGCEVRADQEAHRHLPWAKKAKKADFGYEFLDRILAIKVVSNLDGAMNHIRQFGSGHTESIVTENRKTAKKFLEQVDASSVMVNASTRFSDGFEYGFGAEIGISTDKIHARGPMGLEGLTSYKYVVEGTGQIRK